MIMLKHCLYFKHSYSLSRLEFFVKTVKTKQQMKWEVVAKLNEAAESFDDLQRWPRREWWEHVGAIPCSCQLSCCFATLCPQYYLITLYLIVSRVSDEWSLVVIMWACREPNHNWQKSVLCSVSESWSTTLLSHQVTLYHWSQDQHLSSHNTDWLTVSHFYTEAH